MRHRVENRKQQQQQNAAAINFNADILWTVENLGIRNGSPA